MCTSSETTDWCLKQISIDTNVVCKTKELKFKDMQSFRYILAILFHAKYWLLQRILNFLRTEINFAKGSYRYVNRTKIW
jgi:hypothetical protein